MPTPKGKNGKNGLDNDEVSHDNSKGSDHHLKTSDKKDTNEKVSIMSVFLIISDLEWILTKNCK